MTAILTGRRTSPSVVAGHPLIPVMAMPSMNTFCANEEQQQDGQQEHQRCRHLQLVRALVRALGELGEADREGLPVVLLPV